MPHLEWIWERRNRTPVLLASGVIVLAIGVVDWWTKPYFSLGFLYLFPIMLAAGFLPRWGIVILGLACALLSERFSNLDPSDSHIRLGFEALALCGCGLLTAELLRNRRLSLEAQERMRVLVETSPAAIVTIDERGFIELANRAAVELMAPKGGVLIQQPVAAFLPELHHALCAGKRVHSFGLPCNAGGIAGTESLFLRKSGSLPRRKAPLPNLRRSSPT